VSRYSEDQSEHHPSLTPQAGMPDLPTGPIPLSEIVDASGGQFGSPMIAQPSLVEIPPDQVWREPGTF